MSSIAWAKWNTTRRQALDQLEQAHRRMRGGGPGGRFATEQLNQAYAVLLSSQFQGFCRDLHFECATFFVQSITPLARQVALRNALVFNRKLDHGNANPNNIGSDFDRFGLEFWTEVRNHDLRNAARLAQLEDLNKWRNAIAHQDFSPAILRGNVLLIQRVRRWRKACQWLAVSMDAIMRSHLQGILGVYPW